MQDYINMLKELEKNRNFEDFYNESIKYECLPLYAIKIHRVDHDIKMIKVCKFKNKEDYFDTTVDTLIKYIKSNKVILWCIDTKKDFDNLSLVHPALNDEGKEYLMTSCDTTSTNNLENLPEF